MDEGHFALWHTCRQQFFLHIIVDVELPVSFGRGQIAEQELGQPIRFTFFPDAQHVADTGVHLAARVIRQHRVHEALVEADFPAIIGHTKHIVLGRVHLPSVDFARPFRKRLHHLFLYLGGLDEHGFKLCLGNREMELVAGLDVGHFLEYGHKFGQVEELGKAGPGPVSGALGGQLNGSSCLTESRRPAVKMGQALLL